MHCGSPLACEVYGKAGFSDSLFYFWHKRICYSAQWSCSTPPPSLFPLLSLPPTPPSLLFLSNPDWHPLLTLRQLQLLCAQSHDQVTSRLSVPTRSSSYFDSCIPFHSLFLGPWRSWCIRPGAEPSAFAYFQDFGHLGVLTLTIVHCCLCSGWELHSTLEKCILTFEMSLFFCPWRMGLWYVDHEHPMPFSSPRYMK